LMLAQIGVVQQELGKLAIAVGQLPTTFQEIVQAQFIRENIYSIQAAAKEWEEVMRRPTIKDGRPLRSNDRQDLEEVRKHTRHARFILSSIEPGEQALAATVATLALALEVSLEFRLRGKDGGLREVLDGYIDWTSRILDAERTSSAASAYLKLIDAASAATKQLLAAPPLKGAQWKPDDPQWAWLNALPVCYREYSPPVSIPGRPCSLCNGEFGGIYIREKYGQAPVVYLVWQATSSVDKGLRQWHLKWSTIPKRASDKTVDGWKPPLFAKPACSAQPEEVAFSNSLQAAEQTALSRSQITGMERELTSLTEQIQTANQLEGRKFFTRGSLDVARVALARARSWRGELGQ